MSLDLKMAAGIAIGVFLGLQYQQDLSRFLPLLAVAGMVLLLKTLYHPRVR